ncbi:MAG: FecR domain-containing protein [Burkholderiales bacterium]
MFRQKKLASLLALCGIVAAPAAFAQSGTFTFVTGEVNVQRSDGRRVSVTRGTPVNAGDAIVTGSRGMAQLTMVDQAKISLRPNTQFQIEQYADRPDSDQGVLLNLLRGTLRTFTGLIAARNRDRFVMKTKVATVGIRGSGNVLFAGTAADCDPAKVEASGGAGCDITVNHTIEGSHAVTFGDFSGSGLPPQQGGAQTLITGPGQTVLVTGRGEVRYIPTPQFIADSSTNPAAGDKSSGGEGAGETRNFGPNDGSGSSTQQGTTTTIPIGNNGLGFTVVDVGSLGSDPSGLRDVVISAAGGPFEGQALGADFTLEGGALRGYRAYSASLSGLVPAVAGGTSREVQSVAAGSAGITLGRWESASLGFFGAESTIAIPGSIHWIYANSGYPTYLSDVLTGTATYTLAAATSPTNQLNTAGSLASATLNVNFSNRTLNAALAVTLPGTGGNGGGSWSMNAQGVPFALNAFFASTSDRLVVNNTATGISSESNASLSGSLEGSFVGSALQGAIVGYGISDQSATDPSNHNVVTGVAAFTGPTQTGTVPFRDGLVSDPTGSLASGVTQVRTYATVNRPDEVTGDSSGGVTEFAAPYSAFGDHATYRVGSASVMQAGTDAETGLAWGRWSGGTATVTRGSQSANLDLSSSSLHYVFSGEQNAPVTLPLTGTATYDVIGSTSPTDASGHVGTMNSATLAANFTNRTADASVNITVAGQTLNGVANAMPIYRDQYFSAYTPSSMPGASPSSQLILTCQPSCGPAGGSLDGFFAGRTGQGAGVNYNFNGNAGAVAFRRRGGG